MSVKDNTKDDDIDSDDAGTTSTWLTEQRERERAYSAAANITPIMDVVLQMIMTSFMIITASTASILHRLRAEHIHTHATYFVYTQANLAQTEILVRCHHANFCDSATSTHSRLPPQRERIVYTIYIVCTHEQSL